MKKLILISIISVLIANLFAQSPNSFKYQAIIRNDEGTPIINQNVNIKSAILKETRFSDYSEWETVYSENHPITTNKFGLVNLHIGSGYNQSGSINQVDWSNGIYWLEISVDLTGGQDYQLVGSSQILSVPYAIHAQTADSVKSGMSETDPLFSGSVASNINQSDIDNWDNKLEAEVDGSTTNELQVISISNDTIYLTNGGFAKLPVGFSGNYEDLSNKPNLGDTAIYLKEEIDPQFSASIAGGISQQDTANWNNKLDNEVDGSITNEIQTISRTGLIVNLSNGGGSYIDSINVFEGDMNNQRIINLANPEHNQDAVTKAYVDELFSILENNGLKIVDFNSSNTNIYTGDEVSFYDNSSISATSWSWNFGDGNTSTQQNPTNIYSTEGIYTVSLTASNGIITNSMTKTDFIEVIPKAIDYEGNIYNTIKIDNQIWMAENLKSTIYNDGTPILNISDSVTWLSTINDGYCWYNNDEETYKDSYGALYNWYAVNTNNLCPSGWHIPSDIEWTQLINFLGGEDVAGGKLKETGLNFWNEPNTGATNELNFTAKGGGVRGSNTSSFLWINEYAYFWSLTEYDTDTALGRRLYYDNSNITKNQYFKKNGFSVRCIKD